MPENRPLGAQAAKPSSSRRSPLARALPRDSGNFPVVGIGASAGGLEACIKLLEALPAASGMAFILIQHLDPSHESMMVDLLASHTPMTVCQAADGMTIEPDHLYIIPPGTYLSVGNGALLLSQPQARHGARLPFDFLLQSLAVDCGARAVCVILSGSGADGSLGLKAVREQGGLVIAQDPDEAAYDGMPRNAIATGAVDHMLPVARIPAAILDHVRRSANGSTSPHRTPHHLPEIIELLRSKTAHDFTLYKTGTLQRRIERRMAMSSIEADGMERYLEILRRDPAELTLLSKDLLINVTSFFRDPQVFDLLAKTVIADLVRNQSPDQPLRVWIAGCSTGEETYSLAMLFREAITAAKRNIKLQVFASDVDPDAVAAARDGLYPEAIAADVSPERLARFFLREDHSYRIMPELRATVVFTVQDVLADPPFSRLDLVSCRNLLIYLRPEAQAKVVSVFHFALREGGVLLLGSSETVGNDDGRFEIISKPARLFRHVGRSRPGELGFSMSTDGGRLTARTGQGPAPSRQAALAELCRRLVVEAYAPAAILINQKHECLFSLGPTDRYLRVAPGQPTHDLLAMARQGMRTRLRSAIQQAVQQNERILVAGGRMNHGDGAIAFSIDVQPVVSEGEKLLLICFVDEARRETTPGGPTAARDVSRVAELELELEATRMELRGAIRNLEISNEEQTAINEEALSVNEEFQSTNEELLTSKEELQSLNEELTALNSQLQETLERQRLTSNDLQNILYSTDVATLFLDTDLKIRFFTPATRSLFNVIASDIGRPLADLRSLTADGALLSDVRSMLKDLVPIEREIEAQTGAWYLRRILPYRTQDDGVEGAVITFTDITERKHIARALEAAKLQAEQANLAKSRFLAAASHDMRQPLQTLALLQGLLAKVVTGERPHKLVGRIDETLSAMSGMLNTLLDINQIEAGNVRPEIVRFPINDLLHRLRDEFAYHAQAKSLGLIVMPCGLSIDSDPRLLEQMIRNLLSNALKYTAKGKILLGCRRRGEVLSIEVWDTGVGIPDNQFEAIFEEYHQIDNEARERSRGLGLGLSIVQRLSVLLNHRVCIRSQLGQGSVFSIEVTLPPRDGPAVHNSLRLYAGDDVMGDVRHTGAILIVEDDPEVRELLGMFLQDAGHRTVTAPNGVAALEIVARGTIRPDLILADYNLPQGLNGLQFIDQLRAQLHREIPAVILTGDISTRTLRDIALQNCIQLNKPVRLKELGQVIDRLLPLSRAAIDPHAPAPDAGSRAAPIIFVVDDDRHIRNEIREVLEDDGHIVEDYASCETFLDAYRPGREACLLVDAYLPGMNGLELLRRLADAGHRLPSIMITGMSDVPMAVEAMKAGASDFIAKPIGRIDLLASIERALEQARDTGKLTAWRETAAGHVAGLTPRQRQIMDMVLAGHPSKNIAADLGVSQRTVENHRASIMKKTGSKSLPALARLALAAASTGIPSE